MGEWKDYEIAIDVVHTQHYDILTMTQQCEAQKKKNVNPSYGTAHSSRVLILVSGYCLCGVLHIF